MNWEPIRQGVTALMGALGGYLTAKGVISAELWAQIVGAVLVVAQLVYTIYATRTNKMIATVANLDQVGNVSVNDPKIAASSTTPNNVVYVPDYGARKQSPF